MCYTRDARTRTTRMHAMWGVARGGRAGGAAVAARERFESDARLLDLEHVGALCVMGTRCGPPPRPLATAGCRGWLRLRVDLGVRVQGYWYCYCTVERAPIFLELELEP